jgi:hypothetical protein
MLVKKSFVTAAHSTTLHEQIDTIKKLVDRREAAIKFAMTLLNAAGNKLDPYHPPIDASLSSETSPWIEYLQENPAHAWSILNMEVQLASKGNREADRLLRVWAQRWLKSRVPLSEPLLSYACKIIGNKARPPHRSRGSYHARNRYIAAAVRIITELGYLPTRSPAQRNEESACSIVTKALTELRRSMSEERVQKIWTDELRIQKMFIEQVHYLESREFDQRRVEEKMFKDAVALFSVT